KGYIMGRKINSAILGASFILPGVAGALGLGDITLNSALNQPLSADIVIRKPGDLTPEEVLASLASAKEFNTLGVDRSYFLQDLQFNVKISDSGVATIHLTTRKAVIEPFLNFIVEVQWPEGKLLKEYTLLLDPPVFSQESSKAVTLPASDVASIKPESKINRVAAVGDTGLPRHPAAAESQDAYSAPVSGDGVYGPVTRNDSLWLIASKSRPNKSYTIHQTMVAIQDKNPDAFLRNNINLLKEGQILRLPTGDEIQTNSYQDALARVKQQNDNWKTPVESTPEPNSSDDSSSESQMGGAVEQAPENKTVGDGRLTLVAGSAGEGSAGALGAAQGESDSDTASGLQQALTLKEEALDKTLIENENLKTQFEEVSAQLETSSELIQVKDDQIASLQKQLEVLAQKGGGSSVAQPSLSDKQTGGFLDDPLTLAGIGAAILALIVGLMFARKKPTEVESDGLPEQDFEADKLFDSDAEGGDEAVAEDESELSDESLKEEGEGESPSSDAAVQQELGDVIGEADIYIAYGRFSHAAELLKQGCEAEPSREDIRLKLLEVLVELSDTEGFLIHDEVLRSSSDESVLRAADTLYEKINGFSRNDANQEESGDISFESADTEGGSLIEGVGEDEPFAADSESEFALSAELDGDLTEADLGPSENEIVSSDLDTADLQADAEEDELSSEIEFELPDIDSDDDSALSLDLDIDEADLESSSFSSEEIDEVDQATVEIVDEEALDDTDLDGMAGNELEGLDDLGLDDTVEDTTQSDELELSEGDFELDLDDMGDLEISGDSLAELATEGDDLGLDLDGLADSLEDAGVDFSDVAESVSVDSAELLDVSANNDSVLDEAVDEVVEASGDINLDDDDLDLLSDLDENATKLDLARAYLEMGDASGAKEILEEVLSDGSDVQKQDAEELLQKIA
ncbi:MAG: hypothetical protein KUG76_08240, partial [Gammaproteobacteria bacterium]|nr:hypothetical protein [Gammaproteobacteria bacterium]